MQDNFTIFTMLGIFAGMAMFALYKMQGYKDRCEILEKVFGKKNCDAEVKNYRERQNEYFSKMDVELRKEGLKMKNLMGVVFIAVNVGNILFCLYHIRMDIRLLIPISLSLFAIIIIGISLSRGKNENL